MCCESECVCVPVAAAAIAISLPLALLLPVVVVAAVVVVRACACRSQRHSFHPAHYNSFHIVELYVHVYYSVKSKRLFYATAALDSILSLSIYEIRVRIVCLANGRKKKCRTDKTHTFRFKWAAVCCGIVQFKWFLRFVVTQKPFMKWICNTVLSNGAWPIGCQYGNSFCCNGCRLFIIETKNWVLFEVN